MITITALSGMLPPAVRPFVAVHVALMRHDARVLFQRRAGTGFADGLLGVVSGHVHEGESLSAAAEREVLEEVGVIVRQAHPIRLVQRSSGARTYLDFFFRCDASAWEGVPAIAEPSKCSELLWLSRAEARSRRDALPYIVRGVFGPEPNT